MADTTKETVASLPLNALSKALGGNPRVVQAFQNQAEQVVQVATDTQTSAEATQALQDATVLTLSPNATLNNERVVEQGAGISLADNGSTLTIAVSDEVAHVIGGFVLNLIVTADTAVVLPANGTLATLSGSETLTNKSLNSPKVVGIGDYLDDVAAAAGGVPVGGIYRTSSALKVRVT